MELIWDIWKTPHKCRVPKNSALAKEKYYSHLKHWQDIGFCGWSKEKFNNGFVSLVIRPCNIMIINNKKDLNERYLLIYYAGIIFKRQRQRFYQRHLALFKISNKEIETIGRLRLHHYNDDWQFEDIKYFKNKNLNDYTYRSMVLNYYIYDYDIEERKTYLYLISKNKNQAIKLEVNDNTKQFIDQVFRYCNIAEQTPENYNRHVEYGDKTDCIAHYFLYHKDAFKLHKLKYLDGFHARQLEGFMEEIDT